MWSTGLCKHMFVTAHSENGFHAKVNRKNTLLSKRNMEAWPRFDKLHHNKPQKFWNNTKAEMFVVIHHTMCMMTKLIIPTVKHGGRGVMKCTRFAATGPCSHQDNDELHFISEYSWDKMWGHLVQQLKLDQKLVLQQVTDLKHTSKLTSAWQNKINVLWPWQDLNPTEMLLQDLKRAMHKKKMPLCDLDLKQCFKEE